MPKKRDDRIYRYTVDITTNGHPIHKEFEATAETLPAASAEYMDFVRDQMFGLDGTYYFQRELLICFQFKSPHQPWEHAQSISIFNEKEDMELHLLNWEDEASFFPGHPTSTVKIDGLTFKFLTQNMLWYQVIGELKEH